MNLPSGPCHLRLAYLEYPCGALQWYLHSNYSHRFMAH